MEKRQELEWDEAQKIDISEDLVATAKRQLQFLAEVDRNRCLYDGPVLERAILRYKYCWLPLLAKHTKFQVKEGPLVVPLDCEWLWHCHRLNPVRYKNDCEELYGRILDNWNVASSIQGTCKKQTEEIWNMMYPAEPYEISLTSKLTQNFDETIFRGSKRTDYDLDSAVKRQSFFFYQVSQVIMNDDQLLEEAVARYKGFLHLIKRNRERSINQFCVPTYDIDLIWHSHQLHSASYCKDMVAIMGKVLVHDDTDSDRSKGNKLDVGFSRTTKQWEEAFGSRYWRAGAMYRGRAPAPLSINLNQLNIVSMKVALSNEYQNIIQLPKKTQVEIMLEIAGIKGLPAECKSSLFVSFGKKQPDVIFNTRKQIRMDQSGEKQFAVFQCEPTGELVFELMTSSSFNLPIAGPVKVLGSSSITLENLLNPISKLLVDKWFEMSPSSEVMDSKPISLLIAVSSTAPFPAPYVVQMVHEHPFSKSSCFFPLHGTSRHTCILDGSGNEVISFHMRYFELDIEFQFTGINNKWYFQERSDWYSHIWWNSSACRVCWRRVVIIFPGKKLDYECDYCEKPKNEQDFMTAVEFSAANPYGKAVALLNLKSGFLKINEEWLVLPGILSAFVIADILREDYSGFINNHREDPKEDVKSCNEEFGKTKNNYSAMGEKSTVVAKMDGTNCIIQCCNECEALVKDSTCGRHDGYGHEHKLMSGHCGGCGGSCGGGGGCGGSGNCGGGGCGGRCGGGGSCR
ncbi:glycine-rich domain-containing protein 1 [Quercus suber]|uniref:Glycine-rich domain-containing protein 1 n=1 Tax=Quercus suber TaxID=58331 RepID=A0AAW0LU10_QUESU